ncbi:MAG TPA: HD domain-containing phosphohydrolase [bacterium]|nr:HD domain-containing phosphohydrolase [bacterium]
MPVPDRLHPWFERHPLPAWIYDVHTLQVLDVNGAAVVLYGYSRDEFLAMRITDLCVAEDVPRVLTELAAPHADSEWRHRLKNGKMIDIQVTSRHVKARDRDAAVIIVQGLALCKPKLRDLDVFANVPVGVYRTTADGQFLDANPALVQMLGYPDRESLVATRAVDLYIDPGARERWIAALERDGIVTDFESQVRRYDGSTIWVRATARIVRPSASEAAYLEGVLVDITERKLARTEQAHRTAELQTFYDVSRQLRAARTVEEMYPIIVEQARSRLAADYGCLALLNPERQEFTKVYTVGIPTEKSGSTFPSAGTRSGRVASAGAPFVSVDPGRGEVPEWIDDVSYRALGALAIVPVRSEEDIIGTLCLARVKASDTLAFTETELRLIEGVTEVAGIAIRRARLYQSLQAAYVDMIVALAHAMESRDSYTAAHSERMVALAERMARELACSDREVEDIRWGARLHDIGKIGVSDIVLRKPTILTAQEWAVMRQHPVLGEEILASAERMRGVAKLVRHHQERWDGSGYPDGLNGEAIPLGARILAVVDAYGAITEARAYKPARTHADAVEEIRRCSGTQFDPRVVEVFCAVVEEVGGSR